MRDRTWHIVKNSCGEKKSDMKYYLGVDIGGTNISAGVVNENCELLSKQKVKTNSPRPYPEVKEDIISVIELAAEEADIPMEKIRWIGIGCPGTCNRESGIVEYSNNLRWLNAPLLSDIEESFRKRTFIDNDANVAAYGEYLAGAAKGARNAVVITLGTGVGAGIIIDGKIYSGSNFAGAEIGHTVIVVDGYECTCGRKGCFEVYSSATGLVRMTKEAIEEMPDTLMRQIAETEGRVSARTAFNAAKLRDTAAQKVVDKYIKYLACGIANTINVFQPDILCIGGGVCNEGDNLLVPLKKAVAENIYSKNSAKNADITICSLGNNAGIIGAAMLGRMSDKLNLF